MTRKTLRRKRLSRRDPKIIDLLIARGPAGYGVYLILNEYFREKGAMTDPADYKRIAYLLHLDSEEVRAVMSDFGLFEKEEQPEQNHVPKPEEQSFRESEPEPKTTARRKRVRRRKPEKPPTKKKAAPPRRKTPYELRKKPHKLPPRVITRYDLEFRKIRIKYPRFYLYYYDGELISDTKNAPKRCSQARKYYANGMVSYLPAA